MNAEPTGIIYLIETYTHRVLGKYIPPHLRRAQASKAAAEESREPGRGSRPSRYDNDSYRHRDNGYYYQNEVSNDPYYRNNNYYGAPNDRGVHSTHNFFRPQPPSSSNRPSRWDGLVAESPLTRTHSRRKTVERNRLGFHGSLYPSRMMENELFNTAEHVTEGINFDNVLVLISCHV